MENERCPRCGSEPELSAGDFYRVLCLAHDCPVRPSTGDCVSAEVAWEEWNRRFVRLDIRGKKVFAGDKVKLGKWQGKIELDLVGGAMVVTKTHRLRLSTWKHHELELIKETGK